MIIKTLRVQNFKCFEDKSFEFNDGFNLIIGDNGAGKTAFLDTLAVALGGYLNPINNKFNRRIAESEVHQKSYLSGENLNIEPINPTTIEVGVFLNESLMIWKRILNKTTLLKRTTTKNITSYGKNLMEMVSKGEKVTLPIISYYGTGRLWIERKETESNLFIRASASAIESFLTSVSTSRFGGYEDALGISINRKKLIEWFTRMELISLQEKKSIQSFEIVKRAVQSCLEGCDLFYFDIKYREPVARIQGNLLPFSLLSDGQRSMLAMVADIAYRMAQLNPHLVENVALETPGVVLIDELDLHLHPKWQRKVVENLRRAFPKVQFFATSHSPFIIQSLRPGELIDLSENPEAAAYQDKSIEDIAEKVQGVEMPQRSQRELAMLAAAKEYYHVLEQAKTTDGTELERLKQRLDELSKPYADDIAYIAFLEARRESALKERA